MTGVQTCALPIFACSLSLSHALSLSIACSLSLSHALSHDLSFSLASGLEGETCLRSTDCSEGLCCARHFWSRICKPVLTEGQACTRHRRKGSHGLELFQRCDCGDGLSCRPERGERDHAVSRTQAPLTTWMETAALRAELPQGSSVWVL